MRIFLAGAAGAIGSRLVPMLTGAGHKVVGATRSAAKAEELRAAGIEPVVVDVFDAAALIRAVSHAHADIVVHQLTDLPRGLEPSQMIEGSRRNARIRSEGTQNLVAAALKASIPRMVTQSIAWMYAPGPEPHSEDDPLDIHAEGTRAISVAGVAALERLTVASPPIEGIVLRYGHLYGPATGADAAEAPAIHVDAAAAVVLPAIERGRTASTTSPSRTIICRSQRRSGSSGSIRVFACKLNPEPRAG